MSDFVERCRQEWKRLRVPDAVAEEMAADLAADLNEAEAEGISADEVLGNSVFDPPSFAASWAAERGVIPPAPPPQRQNLPRRPLILGAFAALVLVALFLVVLFGAVLITRAAPPTVAFRRAAQPHFRLLPGPSQPLIVHAHTSVALAPLLLLLLLLAIIAIVITWLWSSRTRSQPPSAPV